MKNKNSHTWKGVTLSAADWQQLQEALAHPPAPNAALKEALDRYKQNPTAKAPAHAQS